MYAAEHLIPSGGIRVASLSPWTMDRSLLRSSDGEYELDQSGELPAKLLLLLTVVGLPGAFAYGIFSIPV